ncbi:hypothetical protein U27_01725 [Candidatus Vecturithrix granuli]|uniref:Uncharacterized protein n=1 Tax=Vecturithrix granuli TaxID=1499967 RepID=A0A0S6WB55_VECG1|nr:hypothetical protein U27_01725 [Candidatus Vecturithrix granuli]
MKDMHSSIWQGVGDALLSFLPMSVFFLWMKVISWAIATCDPYDQYDSRIGMIFPLILPLFFLGLVFGFRACWTVIRLYQRAPDLLTLPIILGITGLLGPFFLGIFLAARFLIQ